MYTSFKLNYMVRTGLYGALSQIESLNLSISGHHSAAVSGVCMNDAQQTPYGFSEINKHIRYFQSKDDLLKNSDAIVFTNFYREDTPFLLKALKNSRHVFVNPECILSEELVTRIQKLGDEAGVLYYFRHNPLPEELQQSLAEEFKNPEFLDIYRYVPTDVDYSVEDIHKILSREILFLESLNHSEIKNFELKTVPYNSSAPYIINIRFKYANCSTANITINFYTHDNSRFAELFYNNQMIKIKSIPGVIEYVTRNKGDILTGKSPYTLSDEENIYPELNKFLTFITDFSFPLSMKGSGLASYLSVGSIIESVCPKECSPAKNS